MLRWMMALVGLAVLLAPEPAGAAPRKARSQCVGQHCRPALAPRRIYRRYRFANPKVVKFRQLGRSPAAQVRR